MTYPHTAADDMDLGIDMDGVDATDTFTPIPVGEYIVQAVQVELGKSGAGNNMVKCQFEVVDGEFKGRKIFENFNIQHPNHQTVEIALKGIKQWMIACGYAGNERLTMGLLASLEGREFMAKLAIEKDKSGMYGDKNRIRSYKAVAGGQQPPAAPAPSAQQQTTAAPDGARPWENKNK